MALTKKEWFSLEGTVPIKSHDFHQKGMEKEKGKPSIKRNGFH